MSIKPDPRHLEELGRAVDRLARAISIPGSSVTNKELKAAQDRYDDALLAALAPKPFDQLAFIMAFEGGELESEEQLAEGFQHLINNGMAWSLQGVYGRTAMSLIQAGLCERAPFVTDRR